MNSLIGEKIGMTQIYLSNGKAVPVTVVKVGPCEVIQIKTLENDGYQSVQLGYGVVKPNSVTKPMRSHFQKYSKNIYRTMCGISSSEMMPLHDSGKAFSFTDAGNTQMVTNLKEISTNNHSRSVLAFGSSDLPDCPINIFGIFLKV